MLSLILSSSTGTVGLCRSYPHLTWIAPATDRHYHPTTVTLQSHESRYFNMYVYLLTKNAFGTSSMTFGSSFVCMLTVALFRTTYTASNSRLVVHYRNTNIACLVSIRILFIGSSKGGELPKWDALRKRRTRFLTVSQLDNPLVHLVCPRIYHLNHQWITFLRTGVAR